MTRPPLLVVGWPGADWPRLHPLLDAGELPSLAGIVNSGASGTVAAVEPCLVASLWTALATGRRATEHGVLGDAEIDPDASEVRPATTCSWHAPALWHTLAEAGRRCHVVGWPATHPAGASEHGGVVATDSYPRPTGPPSAEGVVSWPLLTGAVAANDPEIIAALAELRVSPAEIDAELLGGFVPRWQEVDAALDPRVRRLALALAETLSVHNAATFLLEAVPSDALFVHYGLLERLAPLFLPCSPGVPGIAARHAELYGEVLPAACRWLDRFLTRLQTLAGPGATTAVVSPSGYLSPSAGLPIAAGIFPPSAELSGWRRPAGMFAVAGEGSGVRRDTLVHGVSTLDLVPVFARLCGVSVNAKLHPSAERMEREIFEAAQMPAASSPRPAPKIPAANLPSEQSRAFGAQFLATGEWATIPDATRVRHESALALARSWSQTGDDAFARPILEALHASAPEDPSVAYALTLCLLRLGSLKPARAAAETVLDATWGSPQAEMLRGHFAYCERRYEDAFACFQRAGAATTGQLTGWESLLGLALLKLGRFTEAESAFERSLARRPDDADAHLGQGHARLRLGNYAGAADASRVAIALRYDHPLAHFNLGIALARIAESERAVRQMETVLLLLASSENGGRVGNFAGLAGHTRRVLAVLRRRVGSADA